MVHKPMANGESLLTTVAGLGLAPASALSEVPARQVIFGGDEQVCLLEIAHIKEKDLLRAVSLSLGIPSVVEGPLHVDLALSAQLMGAALPTSELPTSEPVRALVLTSTLTAQPAGERIVVVDAAPTDELKRQVGRMIPGGYQVRCATSLRVAEALAYIEARQIPDRLATLLDRFGSRLPELLEKEAPTRPLPTGSGAAPPVHTPPASVPVPASVPESLRPILTSTSALSNSTSSQTGPGETAPPPLGYEVLTAAAIADEPTGSPASRTVQHQYDRKEAEQDLKSAKTLDQVVDVLVHYSSSRFPYVAAFGVRAGEARGLKSSGSGAKSERVAGLSIPLDLPSVFHTATVHGEARVARLSSAGIEGGITRDLQRPQAADVLLLPITVRDRAILLLWADKEGAPIPSSETQELRDLAPLVAAALKQVLLERKRASLLASPPARSSKIPSLDSNPPSAAKTQEPPSALRGTPLSATKARKSTAAPSRNLSSKTPTLVPPHEIAPAHKRPLHVATRPPPPLQREERSKEQEGRESSPLPQRFPSESPGTLRGFPQADSGVDLGIPGPSPLPSAESLSEPVEEPPESGHSQQDAPPRKRLISRRIVPLEIGSRRPQMPAANSEMAPTQEAPPVPNRSPQSSGSSEQKGPSTQETPAPEGKRSAPLRPLREQDSATEDVRIVLEEPVVLNDTDRTLLSRRAPNLAVAPGSWPPPATEPEAVGDAKPASYSEVVQALLAGDARALEALKKGGETAVGALIAEFPGPVTEPTHLRARASECGPVLHALAQLGPKATPFLTVRTADSNASVRRWATFLLGELPGKESARAIASRLLDDSLEVRRAALSAARRIRSDPLARRTLRALIEQTARDLSLPAQQRGAAIEAMSDVREHEGIPTLLLLLEDELAELRRASHFALCVLTRQDFGPEPAKWRAFWQEHRDEDRVEWLISSLDHEQLEIRRAAGEELRNMAGASLGFDEEQPAAQRRNAQAQFRAWWKDSGKPNSRRSS